MSENPEDDISLQPTQDDLARQAFIVKFKQKVNLDLQKKIKDEFDLDLRPTIVSDLGVSLDDLDRGHRKIVKEHLYKKDLFKAWEVLTWIGQGMMWDCVEDMVDRDLDRINTVAVKVVNSKKKLGSLSLKSNFKPPANIAKVEIHRQPGGFCLERENEDYDLLAGAIYSGGSMMYSAGKGRANDQTPEYNSGGKMVALPATPAPFLIELLEEQFGEQKPMKILDIGCGAGLNTISYSKYYPDAEVYGIDVARGLLRWGHAKAESERQRVHFIQMNSAEMEFADSSFDMVISTIWGHETTPSILRNSISEIWRVLKPGGISFHLDVTNQPGYQGLVDQVLNDWQILHNGEPFWMGWADSDLFEIMTAAGYPENCQFAGPRPRTRGPGDWFVHGAKKTD